MAKTFFTLAMLAASAGPYFAANPDLGLLLATSHDGNFYRPENRSYAEHEARKNASEVVEVMLDDYRAAVAPSLADVVAGAQRFFFPAQLQVAPADGVVKEAVPALADGQPSTAVTGDGSGQSLPPIAPADGQPAAPAPAAPEVPQAPKSTRRKVATPKK